MPKDISHPTSGALPNSIEEMMATFDFGQLVACGLISNYEFFRKYGSSDAIDGIEVVIDSLETKTVPWMPLVAQPVQVHSTISTDGPGQLGAQTVQVTGLDANWMEQTEDVVLNGVNPVDTVASFIRVFDCHVLTTGTYRGNNIGTITVDESESPGEEIVLIHAGHGESHTSHYTVPANKVLLIQDFNIVVESGKSMQVHVFNAEGANDVTSPFSGAKRATLEFEAVNGVLNVNLGVPIPIPAYADFWATGLVSAQTGAVFFGYSGTLVTV